MARESVTYTGVEIGLLAGALAIVLPDLEGDDYEVVDLMLDRAIAAFPGPLSPPTAALIAKARAKRPGTGW